MTPATKIIFTVSLADTNLIFAGLGKLPLEVSIAIWNDLTRQREEAIKALSAEKTAIPPPETGG